MQNTPLSTYGLIQISGPERSDFLQGQFTSDIRTLTPTNPSYSAYCNPQGRVLAVMLLFATEHDIYIWLPLNQLTMVLKRLQKIAVFSQVTLTDVSEDYHQSRIMLATDLTTTADETTWYLTQLLNKTPWLSPITQALFTPHDLNLPELGAVSFNKGCYVGQEIIARMHFRGTPKKHLYLGYCNDLTVLPAAELYDLPDHVCGQVVAVAQLPDLNQQCLAVLYVARDESVQAGKVFADSACSQLIVAEK